MGRKPRLETSGALYHVLNSGVAAEPLFRNSAEARAFLGCLGEVCERMEWRLHAYCLLPGSYQLAVETVRPNLVQGVHWLQSTYGNRASGGRRRLFRGRYRAILVEPGKPWDLVVDYVHLSPVRAGLIEAAQLALFRWSSLRAVAGGKGDGLGINGGRLVRRGEAYLKLIGGGEGREFGRMGRGWVYGGEEFRRKQLERLRGREGAAREEADRRDWLERMKEGAGLLRRNLKRAPDEAKSAPWKVALAAWLQERTGASNRWIGDSLHMGPPDAVSRYVGEFRRGLRAEARREAGMMAKKTAGG